MSETEVTTEANVEISDNLDDFSADFFGQKEPEEKPAATTEGTEQETEDQASEDTEAQIENEEEETEAQEEKPEEKPKKKTFQDRIDELVRQREDQKRQDDAKIAELQRKLEDLEKKSAPPAKVTPELKEPAPDAVNADGEPVYPLGEFDPEYLKDLAKFTFAQERAAYEAETAEAKLKAEADAAHNALQTSWNEKLAAATETHPDFIEKGQALLNGFNDLDQNYAGYLSQVIMSMEKGTDVLYYLSNHPEEAAAIVNSGAQKATLALGRIEARFLESEQNAPKPKVSKAPPPPPVRARGTNGAFIEVAPDTDNLEDFEKAFFKKK